MAATCQGGGRNCRLVWAQGALVPVTRTWDGPGGKLSVIAAPGQAADCSKGVTPTCLRNYAVPGLQLTLQQVGSGQVRGPGR